MPPLALPADSFFATLIDLIISAFHGARRWQGEVRRGSAVQAEEAHGARICCRRARWRARAAVREGAREAAGRRARREARMRRWQRSRVRGRMSYGGEAGGSAGAGFLFCIFYRL